MRPLFSLIQKTGHGIFQEMKQITLNITPRKEIGRTASKHLRQNGVIPAVIYGESGLRHLSVNEHEFAMSYRKIAGSASLIELKSEGEKESQYAIIQELQRNNCTDAYLHIDFKEIVRGKDMEADIPVHTIGIPEGVRNYGGVLDVSTHTLRVRCRPRHLPEEILINVTALGLGKNINLSELTAPEGVTFLDDPESVVLACVGSSGGASDEEGADGEAEAGDIADDAEPENTDS
jgi:large subunit ribosomal protein L25